MHSFTICFSRIYLQPIQKKMITRHKRYEQVNGRWVKIQSDLVTFVCITGEKSAKVIDKYGKQHTVRRDTLLDVPQHILYPNIPVAVPKVYDEESMRKAFYYD
jgi:hypothetical protein